MKPITEDGKHRCDQHDAGWQCSREKGHERRGEPLHICWGRQEEHHRWETPATWYPWSPDEAKQAAALVRRAFCPCSTPPLGTEEGATWTCGCGTVYVAQSWGWLEREDST